MKKVLIVIDYQKDFVNGSLGFAGAEELDRPICEKIEAYRRDKADIIFTFDTHTKEYLQTQEGKNLPVKHCVKGTPGWELYGKTAGCCGGAIRIEKPAFGSLELAQLLREKAYEQVELVGIVSNICVLSNAILAKAALPEALIRVDAACVASNDPRLHSEALDLMQSLHIQVDNRA